ncbi:MAG: TonB-dependent receptor [Pseudomonadales bacterium]
MKHLTLAAISLLLTSASVQSAESELETTIVTATRTPMLLSEAFESISVFTRRDIEKLQAIDIFDLLGRTPGVSFVRNGGRGGATGLAIRGNQTDHSLFLVDGVRIGSATLGSATLSAINLRTVERIEVIRGPKSALYGADAIGGVVNIVTRTMDRERPLAIEASYGSNETSEITALAGYSTGSMSLNVVANFFDTQGIDHTEATNGLHGDEDAYRNNSFALNYRQQFNDVVSLKVSYNRNEGENEYDSDCLDSTFFTPVECQIFSVTQVDSLSALLDLEISDVYSSSVQVGRTNDESNNLADNVDLSGTFNGGEFNTTKSELTWVNTFSLPAQNILTAGVDYQLDEVEGSTIYSEDSRDNLAFFGQLQTEFNALDSIVGVRYDDNEQFGDEVTLSALLGWNINDVFRAYVSYGEGFSPPTFNDLYFPNFGDPTFKPEESQNVELGLKADFDTVQVSAAFFQNEIENLIQFNNTTFLTDQTAEAEISGLEFSVDAELFGFELSLNGSIIDPENKVNGQNLRRRAERVASFDIDRRWDRFGVGISFRAESERFDDPANTLRLAGYSTAGFRASYQVSDQLILEARVDNAFDRQYSTAVDFSLGRYQAIGREAFLTIRYTPRF